jgi:hypothetical protein
VLRVPGLTECGQRRLVAEPRVTRLPSGQGEFCQRFIGGVQVCLRLHEVLLHLHAEGMRAGAFGVALRARRRDPVGGNALGVVIRVTAETALQLAADGRLAMRSGIE